VGNLHLDRQARGAQGALMRERRDWLGW